MSDPHWPLTALDSSPAISFLDLLHELRRRHVFRLLFAASADVDLAGLGFFVADHQQEWHLLHGMLADLGVHLFVAGIDVHANADFFQLRGDFVGVIRVALADRNHHRLHRRQPDRKRAGIVLDQHAEEALDRSIQRAVHHHRLLARSVFGDVFQAEALRQIEIELHRGELPQAPDGVHQLDVDLRTVERGFAGDGLVFDVAVP